MSRFDRLADELFADPENLASYLAADAELQLTQALDAARQAMGISQSELGEKLGRSQSAVSQFLNAADGITIQRCVEYLMALDLTMTISFERREQDATPVRVSPLGTGSGGSTWDSSLVYFELVESLSRSLKQSIRKEPWERATFGKGAGYPLRVVADVDDRPAVA